MKRFSHLLAWFFLTLLALAWSNLGYAESSSSLDNALTRLNNPSYLDGTAVGCAVGDSSSCAQRRDQVSNGTYQPQVDTPTTGTSFNYGSNGSSSTAVTGVLQQLSSLLSSGALGSLGGGSLGAALEQVISTVQEYHGDLKAAFTNGGLLQKAQTFLSAASGVADQLVPGGSTTVQQISSALPGFATEIENGQSPSAVEQQFMAQFGNSGLVQKVLGLLGGGSVVASNGSSPTAQTTQVQNQLDAQTNLLGALVTPH